MTPLVFAEAEIEKAALEWFREIGYSILFGPDISLGGPAEKRASYADVVLVDRLREAIAKINPRIPAEAWEEAVRRVLRPEAPSLLENNRIFHRHLVNGVPVEYRKGDRVVHDQVWIMDFANPDSNDWLAVNQFSVTEQKVNRRADVVVFVNGLPLSVIELKNPADEKATTRGAFNQLQTYKTQLSHLFSYNAFMVASDGVQAKAGTISSGWERFAPWRTIDGSDLAPAAAQNLEVLLKGMYEKRRFLDLIRDFIVFEATRSEVVKKIAGYHQFHVVRKAVDSTVKAVRGDRRIGIVWHTQGAGKSLSMVFYTGKVMTHPKMENPTVVVITDRNDLDDQLFGTFSSCQEIISQKPVQAESRPHLRDLLQVASGGVVFTTIQKFLPDKKGDKFPELSPRRNIVVIADEAHRSQYDFVDGFAKNMRLALPNASFAGFTATPIEKADRNTVAVFGDYIDIYDVYQSIEDNATVPIYYEPRLAKLDLEKKERPKIDPDFEEVTEGEEEDVRKRLRSKWSKLEALVGAEKRVRLVAKDIVDHFEKRLDVMDGKGLIVCMSRRICVLLYDEIFKLRPSWCDPDDEKGFLKVVMTGSAADPVDWQQHIRDKARRKHLGDKFRNDKDPLKFVIVRDMWLTGFDVPSLHTMYVDKPMRGHGLMQAITRVNRVFKDKPGGLVVDYLGIAHELREALAQYSERDRNTAGINQEDAVAVVMEKIEVLRGMFHGFPYSGFFGGKPTVRTQLISAGTDFVLGLEDGKNRYLTAVAELSKAFALAVPHDDALAVQDEVGYFQAVRAVINKNTTGPGQDPEDLDAAVRQIVSRAVSSDQLIDVFASAKMKKPDISILSDEFLREVRGMTHKNLALEALAKLLSDAIKVKARRQLVQSRSFAEMLERTINKYHNRTIEAAQVLDDLIALAKKMREADKRGEKLGLSEDELAFYDALEVNDSAVKILGDKVLRAIARELIDTVRKNVSIDWTLRENVRAKMRAMVKRVLKKHNYPPDKQEKATQTVLEQAELLGRDWAEDVVPGGTEVRTAGTPGTPADIVPFKRVEPRKEDKYRTCVPLLTLKAAASTFGDAQAVEPDGWAEIPGSRELRPGMFVAQVVGRSMELRIPDGAWCLFQSPVVGGRQGRIVLVQHRDIHDPETGGSYTVKRYKSEKESDGLGSWRHTEVQLIPENPEFSPIVLREVREDEVCVVAELVEVLRVNNRGVRSKRG